MTDNPEGTDEQSAHDAESEQSLESIVNPPDDPATQSEHRQAPVQSAQNQSETNDTAEEPLQVGDAVETAEDSDKTDEEPEFPRPDIEPGDPKLEHVVFVLLGVLLTLGVVYQAANVFIL